jgi:hypothetical protein
MATTLLKLAGTFAWPEELSPQAMTLPAALMDGSALRQSPIIRQRSTFKLNTLENRVAMPAK